MGKILLFEYETMADFEVTLVTHLLNCYSGREIVTIGYDCDLVVAASGIRYTPAMTVAEALKLPDIEGLIIPGGFAGDFRPELGALIKRLDGEQRLLAAICAGPHFLARAGALAGRRYTTTLTKWTEEEVKSYGAVTDPFPRETFVAQRMVRDGHIVTAVGNAFIDFAWEIADSFGVFGSPEVRTAYLAAVRGPNS